MDSAMSKAHQARRTHLIQRLKRPRIAEDGKPWKHQNLFSFGGGHRDGGLSTEAMELLSTRFRFDYMGAAEYEYGAVPKALTSMHKASDSLEAYVLAVSGRVQVPWACNRNMTYPERSKIEAATAPGIAYVLAPAALRAHADEIIRHLPDPQKESLKEGTCFRESLFTLVDLIREPEEWEQHLTVGWLELDNGFMFFSDRAMWISVCEMFDVAVPADAPQPMPPPTYAGVVAALGEKDEKKAARAAKKVTRDAAQEPKPRQPAA